jgi:CDP-diacylglycerol--glycerol-3-phosphate 3-phosphatidyltransferase
MANKITLIRIVSLPLLVYFLSYRENRLMAFLALVTFVLLAVTDWLDGYVARSRGEVTGMGKLLDPVADKLLVMTALIPLVARLEVPAWAGILILGREFLINGLRMIAVTEHKIISAGIWGKYKMIVYIVALSVIIGAPMLPPWEKALRTAGLAGLVAGMVLAVISAAEYFRHFTPTDRPSATDPAP